MENLEQGVGLGCDKNGESRQVAKASLLKLILGKQQQTGRVEIDGGRFRAPTSDINQQWKLLHPLELIHSEKQSWEVNCPAGNTRLSWDRTLSSETYGAIADTIAFPKLNFSMPCLSCRVYDTAWGVKEPCWLGANILPLTVSEQVQLALTGSSYFLFLRLE